MELLTGAGLAFSAGLNAYVPLLLLGLSANFTNAVKLPDSWAWLQNPWVLGILGVLLVVEIVADKVPAVDSFNDVLQSVVRPASGGIVFGSQSGATGTLVSDPAQFFSSGSWIPVAVGILISFATHATKSTARPVLNASSFGAAAPVVSTIEDISSVALSILAIVFPILAIILIIGGVIVFVIVVRRARRRIRERRTKTMLRDHSESSRTSPVGTQSPTAPSSDAGIGLHQEVALGAGVSVPENRTDQETATTAALGVAIAEGAKAKSTSTADAVQRNVDRAGQNLVKLRDKTRKALEENDQASEIATRISGAAKGTFSRAGEGMAKLRSSATRARKRTDETS